MVHGDAIQLTGLAGTSLIGFLLVLCRVGGLFVLAPGFSSKLIPTRVKFDDGRGHLAGADADGHARPPGRAPTPATWPR